jgi:hypothetical protein
MPYLNPDGAVKGTEQVQFYDSMSGKIVLQDKEEFEM